MLKHENMTLAIYAATVQQKIVEGIDFRKFQIFRSINPKVDIL